MAKPKNDDAAPAGLSWSEDDQQTKVSPVRARAADDVKGLFASTKLGTGAPAAAVQPSMFATDGAAAKGAGNKPHAAPVLAPPPAASNPDLSTISQLFSDQRVPAPAISVEELSEAELSWQAARQKRETLNDRLSGVEPELEPAPPPPPSAASKKATQVGAFGLGSAPKPAAPGAFAATALAAPKPHVMPHVPEPAAQHVHVPSAQHAPAPPAQRPHAPKVAASQAHDIDDDIDDDDAPVPQELPSAPKAARRSRASKPQPSAQRSKGAVTPPTPPNLKASPLRIVTYVLGGTTLLFMLALAGGTAGLYDLTPEAEAVLVDMGLRSPRVERAPTRAAAPPKASAPKPAAVEKTTVASAPAQPKAAPAAVRVERHDKVVPPPAQPKAAPAAPVVAVAKAAPPAQPKAAPAVPVVAVAKAVPPVETKPAPAVKPVVTPPPAQPVVVAKGDGEAMAESARRKLAAGDVAGAEAILRSVLAADPQEHHAMEVFARVLLAQGKAQEALGYVQQIVKKRAKRAAYRVLEGDVRRALGDMAGARAAWQTAAALDPEDRDAARRLAAR